MESGTLHRVRRGLYLPADPDEPTWQHAIRRHEALLSTVEAEGFEGIVALESAVILHGGWLLREPSSVHLVVSWKPNGLKRGSSTRAPQRPSSREVGPRERRRLLASRSIIRHQYPLAKADLTRIGPLRVTSLERTIEDCARFLEADQALVAADSLFAVAVDAVGRPWGRRREIDAASARLRAQLMARLDHRRGERGVQRARAVVSAATAWSQSPWETEARRLCLISGISAPQPQMPVRTAGHEYFADLGWSSERVIVEVDGDVKYAVDQTAVLRLQSQREWHLTDAGFDVVRFTPRDLRDRLAVTERLRAALPESATSARRVTALMTRSEKRADGVHR